MMTIIILGYTGYVSSIWPSSPRVSCSSVVTASDHFMEGHRLDSCWGLFVPHITHDKHYILLPFNDLSGYISDFCVICYGICCDFQKHITPKLHQVSNLRDIV